MIFDVAFLDVGQGDCAVVTVDAADGSRRRCLVIDAGDSGERGVLPGTPGPAARLAAYLQARRLRYIDLMVGTHLDSDHIGGLASFLSDHTASADGDSRFWNDRRQCIGRFWGPEHDEAWDTMRNAGPGERERYVAAVKLLVKLKLKRSGDLTAEDRAEIARLESVASELVARYAARPLLAQGIRHNAILHDALRSHVAEPDRDILQPDLSRLPESPIPELRIDFLWPDVQVPDSVVQGGQARPLQAKAGETTGRGQRMALADLMERVLRNQEALAGSEDRKANNRSIVLRVGPEEWAGEESSRPAVLFAADAESESWRRILARHGADRLRAAILKAPHHGSGAENGLTGDALAAVAPRYAIVSAGQAHRLPSAEGLNRIRSGGTEIFCTERNANAALRATCAALPPGCVRRGPEQNCGIAFSFDTARATCWVAQLRWQVAGDGCVMQAGRIRHFERDPQQQLWCRQTAWQ